MIGPLLIPRRTHDVDTVDRLPWGQAHPQDTTCPFAGLDRDLGVINTCCSFDMKQAIWNLEAFGHRPLARRLRTDLTAAQCLSVGQEIQLALDAITARYVDSDEVPAPGRACAHIDSATGMFAPMDRPRFDAAVAPIRRAATWYSKVGDLGFGAHVWF